MADESMRTSGMRERKTRCWSKCSACRAKKVKCQPGSRDWERKRQRCDSCEASNLPCGPNYKKKDEKRRSQPAAKTPPSPAICRDHCENVDSETGSSSEQTIRADGKRKEYQSCCCQDDNPHLECAEQEAALKLENFNALGIALMFALGFSAPSCPRFPEAQAPHTAVHAIKEKLHVIFISLTTLGLQIAREGRHDKARWILMKLLLALEKYPGLYDNRKRDALLKIADFFQRIEDHFEYEYVLEKVANLDTPSPSMSQQDNTCSRLAKSYVDTSDRIYGVLADLWPEAFGIDDDLPSDLAVAPQQRALQDRNIAVASELWSHLKAIPPRLSLFNQQTLHIAATYGMLGVVKDLIEGGADIEARDKRHRTPLFLAVLNGHAPCCLALLLSNADHQSRDGHGHTMIEVAARSGHLEIVEHLVTFKADINPYLMWCCSTPLQAATESTSLRIDLIIYLLEHGSDVTIRRPCDSKTAIDIAEERGLANVAQMMQVKASLHINDFWPTSAPIF